MQSKLCYRAFGGKQFSETVVPLLLSVSQCCCRLHHGVDDTSDLMEHSSEGQQPGITDSEGRVRHRHKTGRQELRQWNLLQCLVSFDYWILWLGMFMGIGSGFAFLNNLGLVQAPTQARVPNARNCTGLPLTHSENHNRGPMDA